MNILQLDGLRRRWRRRWHDGRGFEPGIFWAVIGQGGVKAQASVTHDVTASVADDVTSGVEPVVADQDGVEERVGVVVQVWPVLETEWKG